MDHHLHPTSLSSTLSGRMFQALPHSTANQLSYTPRTPGRDYKGDLLPPRKRVSDVGESVSVSATTTLPPPPPSDAPAKKPKVTYPVPNQCMEQGHFYVVLGEDVDVPQGRYKILSLLGQGTFGKVVEAWDRQKKEYCAVKIVRNTPKYTRDAQIEVKYMERVCQRDPMGEYAFVRVNRHFINEQGHMCIVMAKHGKCLLDVIQKSGPMNVVQVAQVAYQLGRTLDYLHTQNRYIHTDLKPENIILDQPQPNSSVSPFPVKVRICDLGGCSDERHSRTSIVSTRHYRAPEVILGLGWMFPADMWSVGCILYELAVGRLLYDTHDNLEHLNMMQITLGPMPSDWGIKCMDEVKPMFNSTPPFSVKSCPKSSRMSRLGPIETLIGDEGLASLIRSLLNYDQNSRLTARQLMTHPFVTKYCPEAMQGQLNPVPSPQPPVGSFAQTTKMGQ
eukprot:PhF_6_TR19076/c1_g1_i1/m.28049/K08287/E2.7.12.1; dual-specificity kinase